MSELTPAQHAAIRRQLFLIPVYIWVIYSWSITVRQLPVGTYAPDVHVARDFVHFYSQGVATREHDAHALYDLDALAAVVARLLAKRPGERSADGAAVASELRAIAANVKSSRTDPRHNSAD